ncbi:MAG: ThuA domain-containing protein [Candidatus Korobacteraceae bacterium]
MRKCCVIALTLVSCVALAQGPAGPPAEGRGGAGAGGRGAANQGRGGNRIPRRETFERLRSGVSSILGWRLGTSAKAFPHDTLDTAGAAADAAEIMFIAGSSKQKINELVPKNLDAKLKPGEMQEVRDRLRHWVLNMPVYFTDAMDSDEQSLRKLFEFARDLRIETIVSERMPASLLPVEKLADEFKIKVALTGDPKSLLSSLEGRGPSMGAFADVEAWMKQGVKPAEAVAQLKDRVLVVRLSDASLGGNAAPAAQLLEEMYRLEIKPTMIIADTDATTDVRARVVRSVESLERAVQGPAAKQIAKVSKQIPIFSPDRLAPEVREKVLAALPQQAAATPKKPRKLLVFDANVGRAGPGRATGHASMPAANLAVEEFAKKTGAFEAVFSNDIENFKYEKLKQFDAVFLNNNVGPTFVDPQVREGLLRFVREGGGLAGYHAASVISMDWPEFRTLLGAAGANHRAPTEVVTVKIDDPKSPLTAVFQGKGFEQADEFYRFDTKSPTRDDVHVLMSFDVENTDMNQGENCPKFCVRANGDYPVSWIRREGKGRVFYTSMGHTPAFFMSKELNQFFFAALQFVLGDMEADTTPSNKLRVTSQR